MEPSRQTWSSYGPPYPLGRWSSDFTTYNNYCILLLTLDYVPGSYLVAFYTTQDLPGWWWTRGALLRAIQDKASSVIINLFPLRLLKQVVVLLS